MRHKLFIYFINQFSAFTLLLFELKKHLKTRNKGGYYSFLSVFLTQKSNGLEYRKLISKGYSIAQTLRLPSICALCNQFHKNSIAVCSHCFDYFKLLGPACHYCAYPLPDEGYPICGQCIKKPPSFDTVFIAYIFEEPLRGLLHQFKYHNGIYLTSVLGQLMLQAIHNHSIGLPCLIPVPMHPKRLRQRGFNQAVLLTKYLAKKLNLPYDLTSCQKIINTPPQANLNSQQRRKNLKQAFHTAPLPYQHVILVDDLLTTGSTLNELAHTIKKAGVKRVDVWCCARTVNKT